MRSLAIFLSSVTFVSSAAAAPSRAPRHRAQPTAAQLAARTPAPAPVVPTTRPIDPYRDPAPQWPWDTRTEYQLMVRLGEMRGAATGDVHVRSVHGAITLYGSVPDEATHTRVLLAVNADPHTRVLRDELTIRPTPAIGGGPSETTLVEQARARVASDPGAVGGPLRVQAMGNVLTVAGRVATYDDAERVMFDLKSIPGVRAVRSALDVNEATVIPVAQ